MGCLTRARYKRPPCLPKAFFYGVNSMLPILQNQSALTMSSIEIADLVNSRHDKVKQSIERLASDNKHRKAVIQLPPMGVVTNDAGHKVSVYQINKRDSYVIVAQLSPQFTAKLVDRWQELEQKAAAPSIPNFNDPVAAARAWADAKEAEIKAIQYAEAARPAVEFVDRYVKSTGNLGFRQVCKLLKAKENDFRSFLQDNRIMYRLNGDWVPYASHIDAGRFYVATGIGDNNHNFTSAKFTPKGVEWIAKLWGEK